MNLAESDKRKLRDALAVKSSLNGNLMTFIGLDEVRERFPDLWDKHRDRIAATSQAVVRQFTDPSTDIVLPVGGSNFVILFTRLDKREAMLRSTAIKAEILRRFIGDDALSSVQLQTRAMSLDTGEIFSDSLGNLLAQAMQSASAAPARPNRSAAERPDEKTAASPERRAAKQRMYRASIEELGVGGPVSVETLEKRFGFNVDDLEFAFQPYLYVSRNVFSVFECRAVRYSATRDILSGYAVLPRDATGEQVAALDEMTLMRARHGLVDMAVRKRVAVVVAPVSFETVSNRATTAEYLSLVQKVPSDLRNYLAIDLCRSPGGIPEGRLAEIVSPLKRLVRAVFVRVTSPQQPLAAIKAAGAFGVGIELPAKGGDLGNPVFLQRFVATARKLGLQTYANEVDTAEKAEMCRSAGFHYLSGRAMAELSDYVGPVTEMHGV